MAVAAHRAGGEDGHGHGEDGHGDGEDGDGDGHGHGDAGDTSEAVLIEEV